MVLDYHGKRAGFAEARVGEDRPLPALDVDLEKIGFDEEREHVHGLDINRRLAGLGQTGRSKASRHELRVTIRDARCGAEQRPVDTAVRGGGGGVDIRVFRVGFDGKDACARKAPEDVRAEQADVRPQVDDAEWPIDGLERGFDLGRELVLALGKNLIEHHHVRRVVAKDDPNVGPAQPIRTTALSRTELTYHEAR